MKRKQRKKQEMYKCESLTIRRMLKWVKGQQRKRTRGRNESKRNEWEGARGREARGRRGAAPRGLYDSLSCCWLVRHWRGAGGGDSGEVCAFNYGLPIYMHCSDTRRYTHIINEQMWRLTEKCQTCFLYTHTHTQTDIGHIKKLTVKEKTSTCIHTPCLH